MAGERIVVSGNFLLDSESRMKAAAVGASRRPSSTMSCAAWTSIPPRPRAAGRVSQHAGHTYYFCSDDCKKQFDADPAKFTAHK